MLYPQNNRRRTAFDLSGFWEIRVDRENSGIENGWSNGFSGEVFIGVPGSWNEQLSELGLMNYTGAVWYQTTFTLPEYLLANRQHFLRFGSVDFNATVWVNGKKAGEHRGGYIAFEFDVTGLLHTNGENLIVARVDNRLDHTSIPQGISPENFAEFGNQRLETFPATVFDFFAYGGIQRPVKLISLSAAHISDIRIKTHIDNASGHVAYRLFLQNFADCTRVECALFDGKKRIAQHANPLQNSREAEGELLIPECVFWSPETPKLYQFHAAIFRDDELIDEYRLDVGVREISVTDDQLLLNGKPVFLRGFGKHEDFDVLGKGLSHPLIVKDFQLMKWIGANSFRTSHYPYAEEMMQMADREGFLVIDEVPAVSLNFRYVNEQTLKNHKRALSELIDRDFNHPCVISWSIANEPGIWGEPEAVSEKAHRYWREIYRHTKSLDPTRPITLPTCVTWKEADPGYEYCDFISVNRYWGWYEIPGDLEKAGEFLKTELQNLHQKFRKPILVAEFGADTIEGQHATSPQLFTEEYQVLFLEKYFEVIGSLPFMVGEHIWNFADFRAAQHHRRVVFNKKGVFTRSRHPKTAAFAVRKHWLKSK